MSMTHDQIDRAFDAGRLTAAEAANAVMALRPRPSRLARVLGVLVPLVLCVAAWVCVFLDRGGR